MLEHPHVRAAHPTIRWTSGKMSTVYVVKTDLQLSRDEPDYDDEAFNDLMTAVAEYIKTHDEYDSADIVPFEER